MPVARLIAPRISLTACLTALLTMPVFAATESVYYSFNKNTSLAGGSSGGSATLLNVNGALYGTTSEDGDAGLGTVYKITKSGAERVLHSFGSGTDGARPAAGLILVDGTLYGTTELGGAYGYGTVYSITAAGSETVLHSFAGPDGSDPIAPLLDVGGTLYGTTDNGGAYNCGSVFSITPAGIQTTLYSFRKGEMVADRWPA